MPLASLWGSEFDIESSEIEKTAKILKKIKKPKVITEVTTDKLLKSKNATFEEKLTRVKEEVERILGGYKTNTLCICDKNDLHEYITACINNKVISIDTETLGTRTDIEKPGTDPLTCKLGGLCLYTPGQKNVYVPVNHVDYKTNIRFDNQLTEDDIRDELARVVKANITNVFQNGKFDYMVLYYTCGIRVPITWDTMIGSQLLNENEQAGLKFQYKDKINPEQEKYDIDKLFDLDNLEKYPYDLFSLYAATDAYMTYELYKYQKKEFEKPGNERLYNLFLNIEMPVVTVTSEMQIRGVGVDQEFAKRLSNKFHKKLDEVNSKIDIEMSKYQGMINRWRQTPEANYHEVIKGKTQKSLSEKLSDPVEITSATQLGIFLYDVLKVLRAGRDGKKKVDEETLLKLDSALDIPLIKLILKKREYDKYLGTYIDALPLLANPRDGRLHPKFNQLGREEKGVVTGRFSSTDPNFQNIPARGNITSVRCMIVPTVEYYTRYNFDSIDNAEELLIGDKWVWKEDFKGTLVFPIKTRKRFQLCGSDFSAQEVKVFAQTCGDKILLDSLMKGRDLYSEVASKVYNMPYEECCEFRPDGTFNLDGKARRTKSKSIVLGLMYGRGNTSIAEQIKSHPGPITKEDIKEAKDIVDNFFTSYPGAKEWVDRMHKQAHEKGYVEDLWGRRRRLPDASLPKYEFSLASDKEDFNPLIGAVPRKLEVDKSLIEKYTSMLDKCRSQPEREDIINRARYENLNIKSNTGYIATAERQSQNSPIQGGAATMTKIAMKNIHFDPELNSLDFHLLIPVHDELIGEAPLYYIEQAKKRMFYLMCNAGKPEFKLPMKCDGDDWSRWYLDVAGQHIRDEYTESIKEGKTEEEAFNEVHENNCEFTEEQIKLILENNKVDV